MSDLKGKKVLFIAQKIYGYEYEIKATMESLGAEVDLYHERPYGIVYKAIKNLIPQVINYFNNLFLNNILKNVMYKNYDFVFMIRTEIITIEFLKKLRLVNPDSKFIMYQWDSVKLNPYTHLIPHFDIVYSFDMVDCQRYKHIKYLPLFYRNEYADLARKKQYRNQFDFDILIVGTFHYGRESLVKNIATYCENNNLKLYTHLYLPKEAYIKDKIKGKNPSAFSTKQLSTSQIVSLYQRTKTVLDLPQNEQNGFTMRTFEVLGSNKKLITTNKNIEKSIFYNPDYIYIFNPDTINFDSNFINNFNEDEKFNNEIKTQNIENWVRQIFLMDIKLV